MRPHTNVEKFCFLDAEFGTFHYHSLSNCNHVRENMKLKIGESHTHVILAPYTETILQLRCSIASLQIAHTPQIPAKSKGTQHTLRQQVVQSLHCFAQTLASSTFRTHFRGIRYLSSRSQNHGRDSIPKHKHRSKAVVSVRRAGIDGCRGQRHMNLCLQ